ncbi:hypothetical protein [Leptospira sp. GIMC2001]|uniref:hypothetical protein n=1 Tax=Leptospira sp. GIMC2001 TaxID=1513297 RepID=UPI00234A255F|nr:hypothetical protein [Leptospira sp. GIMC2001]WCL49772.1 hypothetical protein O4O04_02825 [Leptospira sp. GIMC2001]
MKLTKKSIYILAILLVAAFANCKKDKGGDTESKDSSVESLPTFDLSGSPAQNLITVFEAGIAGLESNSNDPAAAARELEKILSAVSVDGLRAKAKSAKEAGQGATDDEKQRLNAAMEKYKKLAASIGSQDPGAFNAAHTKWSAAFGVK